MLEKEMVYLAGRVGGDFDLEWAFTQKLYS